MAANVAMAAAAVSAPAPGTDGVSSVHWFRKGLRLHDNPALLAAVRGARCVRCVYILDPWFAASSSVGINRWSTIPSNPSTARRPEERSRDRVSNSLWV
ncbi:Cryptochrome-2 [Saguinus oedipus]|uniref:Cryptochrome-2 n=1 Tax=Saguinus oedipus TaxID=9490 RepID=A0ABQ9UUQ0_SAGOE|nr:Cryptochrome-2 [Saguinus oedipus]